MNLLVVGVSHRTANVAILDRLAASPQDTPHLLTDLMSQPYVGEAMVLSTCNRVEIYAGVTAFHGGLADVAAVLAARLGSTAADLAPHMYVHFDADAARHAFRVATGLDSMVVGEPQILGQLRDAYALAAERDTAGRLIHDVMQQALRVGKRAHAETDIDRAGQNVVSAALNLASPRLPSGGLAGVSALVVGAGSMGALAIATLRRNGAGQILITNRDASRAARLAELHGATAVPFGDLADAVGKVDLVISATTAPGYVLTTAHLAEPVVLLDLAVPRDIDPAVAALDGVTLIDMEMLAASIRDDKADGALVSDEAAVESIVATEVDAFRTMLRGATVAPTVAALRARADEVVSTELHRLGERLPNLTDPERAEVAQAVHRVVQRLLHSPTVRVRELAAGPGGDRYAELLRELFELDVPPVAETIADVPPDACASSEVTA